MARATMKSVLVCSLLVALAAGQLVASDSRVVPLTGEEAARIADLRAAEILVQCGLSYYYLPDGCHFATVVGGIAEGEAYGVHFNMTDVVPWSTPCDTAACLTLDLLELVLYDVLVPPADQRMNVKVYGADGSGNPSGDALANRDFEPTASDSATFITAAIDFTNGGSLEGLDLHSCRGNFVVLLTWKNSTGHPLLVLDNISTYVSQCGSNAACCQMGNPPYLYPRFTVHTGYYGNEPNLQYQSPVSDPEGAGTYGYLEAFWGASFCKWSTAVVPTSWGAIKATYH
ncbi:MAG TPA: hypothetical protein VMU02_09940 [bacterium]|nr:hypothetical protein [bacterium]